MLNLTDPQLQALRVAAKIINCDPTNLRAVIQFESAWNPLARNAITGARGLIQFMPRTAQDLGFDNADQLVTLLPGIEGQLLGPVVRYYKYLVGGAYTSLQAIAMGTFYPAFKFKPETEAFPAKVQEQNPGIKTVADYMNKVRSRLA